MVRVGPHLFSLGGHPSCTTGGIQACMAGALKSVLAFHPYLGMLLRNA